MNKTIKWIVIGCVVALLCIAAFFIVQLIPKPEPLPGDYHLDPANFAFGKTMTVSGEEISKGNVAANMTDGDLETRWAAADGSYWEVELDAFGNVTSIEQEGWH